MRRVKLKALCTSIAFVVSVMVTNVASAAPDNDGGTATCGNGVLESDEECDDGNLANYDGCSAFCRKEVCKVKAERGRDVFPWFSGNDTLYVRVGVSQAPSVTFQYCADKHHKPVVTMSDEGKKYLATYSEWEDDSKPDVVRSQWRLYVRARCPFVKKDGLRYKDCRLSVGKNVTFKVTLGNYSQDFVVMLRADGSMVKYALNNADAIKALSDSNKRITERVVKAERMARSAKARTRADVEIALYGAFVAETPGRPGGGVGIATNIIFGRFAKDVVHLGVSANVSFMRYQLEIDEDVPNFDASASKWDFGLSFLLRLKAHKYLYFDLSVGGALSVMDYSDLMHWQEQNPSYQVHMINGRTARFGLLIWGGGIFFPVHHNFAFGFMYRGSLSLAKQECLLHADGQHEKCMAATHAGTVDIRARF